MYKSRNTRSSEEDILLSIHRHRIRNLPKVVQNYSPSPSIPKNSGRIELTQDDQDKFIWGKINRSTVLPQELSNQFGGNAQRKAVENYGWNDEEREIIDFENVKPKLIDEMMMNRMSEQRKQKEFYSEHLRQLSNERERLIEARRVLEEKKRNFRGTTPLKPITPDYQAEASFYSEPDWQLTRERLFQTSRAESSQSVMGIESVINETRNRIPTDTEKVNQLRKEFEAHYNKKLRPYCGELGPQTYESWQTEGYDIVRTILDDFVDNFLDNYFRVLPPAYEKEMAHAFIAADQREWEQRKKALSQTKAVQLIMEEIILEETCDLAESIAQEFMVGRDYLINRSNLSLMKTAEAIATMDEGGRSEDDSSYNLITRGYYKLQSNRNEHRPDVWAHTQHLHLQGPQPQDDDDQDEDDVIVLDTHPISPMEIREYEPKPSDLAEVRAAKEAFRNYQQMEVRYWGGMTTNVYNVALASKCQGISCAQMSPSQRYLAIGSVHGDITVYDLHWEPMRPIGAIYNHAKGDDPIISLAWSGDSTRIVSVSQTGDLIVWTSGGSKSEKEARADSKGLEIKKDTLGIIPNQMSPLVRMDAENQDFSFQIGPLAEHGAQNGNFGPTLVAFHPTRSFFGQQHSVCVAVENHDVIKCNFEETFTSSDGMPYQEGVKIHQPTVPPLDGQQNYIGQGVSAEMFRKHRTDIILLGFIDNFRSLLTVDNKTYINLWKYNNSSLSEYGWFNPYRSFRLEKTKVMYEPTTNAQPNIVFTDRPQGNQAARSRQEIGKARRKAEKIIAELNLRNPWHREYLEDQSIMTSIYPPNQEVPTPGALFHVIMRHADSNQLSTYLTRLYRPTKINSTKLLAVKQTPTGNHLVFLLLFPEFPPKEAHISVFIVDLTTQMELKDFRRDIIVKDTALYNKILEEDIISCDVTPVLGSTGGYYLFLNLAGELMAYSMNTGMKTVRVESRPNNDGFAGCRLSAGGIPLSPHSKLVVAGTLNKFFLIAYADKRDQKNANKLVVTEFKDETPESERNNTWAAFRQWQDHPEVPTQDLRVDASEFDLHNQHMLVAMSNLILELADYAVQRDMGDFTDDQLDAIEDSDRVRNYEMLEAEVKRMRTPDTTGQNSGADDMGGISNGHRRSNVGIPSGRSQKSAGGNNQSRMQ